jgi:tubulin polyglutamylase TTLL11
MSEAKGDCFQILGFDIFIDQDLKAWLFEINDHPSLNINLEKEGEKGLIKEVSEIDKYLKVKILGEAIQLMKKKTLDRMNTEIYKGWFRILPDGKYDQYDLFYKVKTIFTKL